MTEQIPDPERYIQPQVNLVITTYELAEDDYNNPIWKATVTHMFSGETVKRIHDITEAHKKTDAFFAASFKGILPWKNGNIYLKNSEQEIVG